MQLTPEQANLVVEKLNQLWGTAKTCSVCRGNHWTISDRIYEMREFESGGLVLGRGTVYPVIVATCAKCGNTKLFNAVGLGVLTPEPEKAIAGA